MHMWLSGRFIMVLMLAEIVRPGKGWVRRDAAGRVCEVEYCLWCGAAAPTPLVTAESIQVRFGPAHTQPRGSYSVTICRPRRYESLQVPIYLCDLAPPSISQAGDQFLLRGGERTVSSRAERKAQIPFSFRGRTRNLPRSRSPAHTRALPWLRPAAPYPSNRR